MNQSEFPRFAALILSTASSAYRQDRVDENTIGLYFQALEPWSASVVEQALARHIRDPERGRFFPTVADIVAKAELVRDEFNAVARVAALSLPAPEDDDERPLSEDPVQRSQQIWALVLQQIGRKLATGHLGDRLPDSENTRLALLECGAFERLADGSIRPVGWLDLQRQPRVGEVRLISWVNRHHAKFRQAYCRRYGIDEAADKYDPPKFGAQFERRSKQFA